MSSPLSLRLILIILFGSLVASSIFGQEELEGMEYLDPDKCYIQVPIAHDTIVQEFAIPFPRFRHQLKTKKKELLMCMGVFSNPHWVQRGESVWCLESYQLRPDKFKTINIVRRPKKVDSHKFEWQQITYLETADVQKIFIPVACGEQLTKELYRQMSEKLYIHGYSKHYGLDTLMDIQHPLSEFEKDQCLPSAKGQVSLATLKALDIQIN